MSAPPLPPEPLASVGGAGRDVDDNNNKCNNHGDTDTDDDGVPIVMMRSRGNNKASSANFAAAKSIPANRLTHEDATESTAAHSSLLLDPDGDGDGDGSRPTADVYPIVEAVEVTTTTPSRRRERKDQKKERKRDKKKRKEEKKKKKERKEEEKRKSEALTGEADDETRTGVEGDHGGEVESGEKRRKEKKSSKKKKRKKDKKKKRRKEEDQVEEEYGPDGVRRTSSTSKRESKHRKRRGRNGDDDSGACSGIVVVFGSSDAEEEEEESKGSETTGARSRRDPDGSVTSASMTSADTTSVSASSSPRRRIVDATSSERSALGGGVDTENDSDEDSDGGWDDHDDETDDEDEDDESVSLFLSPSNECDTSATSDDCFEPSPEWLESVRAQHARYAAMLRSSPRDGTLPAHPNSANRRSGSGGGDSLAADADTVASSPPIAARTLHYESLIGEEARRPSFQSPMSDLTPSPYPAKHREGVELVDVEGAASSGRFDPKDLPVIIIPRGVDDDGARGRHRSVRFGQDEHLQKSLSAKQRKERRKRSVIAGFVALNVLLVIGVAMLFLVPWLQNRVRDGNNSSAAPPPESPQQVKCFETSQELESAVDQYLALASPVSENATVVQTYGYIRDWCVDSVTSMDALFSATRNPNATAFNEPISPWNVGSVTSMRNMFEAAASFDQDLSSWDVRLVQDLSEMFMNARRFRQNMCDWLERLPTSANLTNAFVNTSCDAASTTTSSSNNATTVFLCLECFTSY